MRDLTVDEIGHVYGAGGGCQIQKDYGKNRNESGHNYNNSNRNYSNRNNSNRNYCKD